MCYFLRTASLARLLALSVTLFALAILSSACSGTSAKLDTALNGATSNGSTPSGSAKLPGLPALPSPATIGRGASVIETSLTVQGSSFRPDLTHQNVSVSGDDCFFDPAFLSVDDPQFSQVALAIFSFSLLDSSGDPVDLSSIADLNLDGRLDLVVGTARVFAGFPALSLDKWEWTELEKKTNPIDLDSFSWGMSNPSSLSQRAPNGLLNVCIVVFGDTALTASKLSLQPEKADLSLTELFRKGWDGTIKGRSAFDSSVSLCVDSSSTLHCAYYDSSVGQLFHLRLADRVVTTQAVECDVDSGLTNDMVCAPDGRLLLSYWGDDDDDEVGSGLVRELEYARMVWKPSSSFDTGDGGAGLPPSDVGRKSSIVVDSLLTTHIFYEDSSNGRIMHASRLNGLPPGTPYLIEAVSPPGTHHASSPVALDCDDGVCCMYIQDEDGDSGTDNRLMLARFSATGWTSEVMADDVHNPDPTDYNCDGFCDASVFGDLLVSCYSSSSGFKVSVHNIASSIISKISARVANPSPSSGAFCDLEMLGDGSVRIAHCDTFDTTLFFTYSSVPTDPAFSCSSVLALQYGEDEDCDDIAFYVDPDDDADGFHEAVLVELSSSTSALTQSRRHELTGHVTLIK